MIPCPVLDKNIKYCSPTQDGAGRGDAQGDEDLHLPRGEPVQHSRATSLCSDWRRTDLPSPSSSRRERHVLRSERRKLNSNCVEKICGGEKGGNWNSLKDDEISRHSKQLKKKTPLSQKSPHAYVGLCIKQGGRYKFWHRF